MADVGDLKRHFERLDVGHGCRGRCRPHQVIARSASERQLLPKPAIFSTKQVWQQCAKNSRFTVKSAATCRRETLTEHGRSLAGSGLARWIVFGNGSSSTCMISAGFIASDR